MSREGRLWQKLEKKKSVEGKKCSKPKTMIVCLRLERPPPLTFTLDVSKSPRNKAEIRRTLLSLRLPER